MTKGVFDGLWRYGQKLHAFDEGSDQGREFYGFLESMSFSSAAQESRDRAGIVPDEEYRLIVEPAEALAYGKATMIVCGGTKYELLSVEEVYDGDKVSHRECVLLKVGEVDGDA